MFSSNIFAMSNFLETFIVASIMFYIATRIVRQDWQTKESNIFRLILTYTFYLFGVILLMVSLLKVGNIEQQRNNKQTQQDNVKDAQVIPNDDVQMTTNKEK